MTSVQIRRMRALVDDLKHRALDVEEALELSCLADLLVDRSRKHGELDLGAEALAGLAHLTLYQARIPRTPAVEARRD